MEILGQTKRFLRGCENFLPALAQLLCLALPGSCLAKQSSLLDQLSRMECPVLYQTYDMRDRADLQTERHNGTE